MKLARMLSTFAFTALLGSAALAGPAEKKPAPAAPAKTDDAAKVFAFFDALVDAVTKNTENCDKMAASVNTVLDKHGATIKIIQDYRARGEQPPKEVEDKLRARAKELVPAITKCASNEAVQATMKRMQALVTAPAAKPAK
jgi:hypothetical protein